MVESLRERRSALPSNCPPAGLKRTEAAEYVGVSVTTFDKMVIEGKMPRAKRATAGRLVWIRSALDVALAALPDESGAADNDDNPWD